MTRNGKIARLPRPLQDKLNRHLERGLPGRQLAAWLNALPEVQEVLHDRFEGKPVSEQNLSEWLQSGFTEWHVLTNRSKWATLRRIHGSSCIARFTNRHIDIATENLFVH